MKQIKLKLKSQGCNVYKLVHECILKDEETSFKYTDDFGAVNEVIFQADCFKIKRHLDDYESLLKLNPNNGEIHISSKEGNFKIDVEIIKYQRGENFIFISYNTGECINLCLEIKKGVTND